MEDDRGFTHNLPGDLMENKEKFLRVFSVTNIVALVIAAIPGLFIFYICSLFGSPVLKTIGIVLWILIEGFAYLVTAQKRDINVHREDGGGRYIYQVWIERIKLKRRRALYIKGYDVLNGGKRK